MLDVTPFEPFTKTNEMQKMIGTFANTKREQSGSGNEEEVEEEVGDPVNLAPPPFYSQTIPGMNSEAGGRPRRSYKAYSFARRNLCSLAEQFRAIADNQSYIDKACYTPMNIKGRITRE
mmetsp:Transcript_24299/g.24020  ORF Transcript_24299/g.24020 Transcript_24299/m.24020 type:complete len:119 (-) Transcript_24299:175-531(-)